MSLASEDSSEAKDWVNDSEVNELKQKLETVEKELEESRSTAEQHLHQAKSLELSLHIPIT